MPTQVRIAVIILAMAAVLVTGCSSAAQPRTVKSNAEKKVQALQAQAQGLKDILHGLPVAVEPEPEQDISHGIYLGRIEQISTNTSEPSFLIDFVTPEMIPGTTDEQRRRSSWSNYFGWNKSKHPQKFSLSQNATLITGGLKFVVVSSPAFIQDWLSHREPEMFVHYFIINRGEIDAVWPWLP